MLLEDGLSSCSSLPHKLRRRQWTRVNMLDALRITRRA